MKDERRDEVGRDSQQTGRLALATGQAGATGALLLFLAVSLGLAVLVLIVIVIAVVVVWRFGIHAGDSTDIGNNALLSSKSREDVGRQTRVRR